MTVQSKIKETFKIIILAILIAIIINKFIVQRGLVVGDSMNKTLRNGQQILIDKITKNVFGLHHGDIVIIKAPDRSNTNYIKRVIGLPGDIIEIKQGKVYRNGILINETYTNSDYTHSDITKWVVPKDEIYVLGDNRLPGMSKDSRIFNTIYTKDVVGIARTLRNNN